MPMARWRWHKNGDVRVLNMGHLKSALRTLTVSERRLKLQGLQQRFQASGLEGGEL